MRATKEVLLNELPPFTDTWVKIKDKQSVPDIIKLICSKHKDFSGQYDVIAPYFIGNTVEGTCNNLYDFCEKNLLYKEETEEFQIVGNPASIISRGNEGVDCKSYACFIGGCLDAIRRSGKQDIDWHYCFASYDPLNSIPYHVFVVVETDKGELYVDPTPGSANKEPVWIINKKVSSKIGLVGKTVGTAGTSNGGYGELIPAPAWYPAYLPKFYRNNGAIQLRPLNAVPNYTANDVLDGLLYLQTIIGYNRTDWQNAKSVAWMHTDNGDSGQRWIQSAFKQDGNGDGGGDFANIGSKNLGTNGALYSNLQTRYIANESAALPWLKNMQGKAGGIDLMTIPMATDVEIPRPSFYPNYLPSLFISTGQPYQYKAGFMTTKPMIRTGKSSGWTDYVITPDDVAALMLYAQPIIAAGPTPYPVNWYINDVVNGAMAFRFKITLGVSAGFTDSQEQQYGITGDMMDYPRLDEDPFASGFTTSLETIIKAVFTYVPGVNAVYKGVMGLASAGGAGITGGPSPAGAFSAAVYTAADTIAATLKKTATNMKYLLLGILAAAGLGWYYWDDIKKEI